jgi:hypothetical protein
MSRSIILCLALGAVPLCCLACEKEGATTSAEGDAAQSEFAKVREDYRHQRQTELDSLDKTLADVEAKGKTSVAKTKTDLDASLAAIKAERTAFMSDLRALDGVGAPTWDSAKARLDKEWADLKMAAERASSLVASARAGHKPGAMTCGEFVALPDVERSKLVYWVEGFNESGKAVDTAVDVHETDSVIPALVAECTKSPKDSLTKVVQQHASTAPKPAAAAPKPEKMTCDEFVALADVERPKLVYWAEGFNKDGGAADSVVDVVETDRLVPVLVKECQDEPKTTLWQKIKKYF